MGDTVTGRILDREVSFSISLFRHPRDESLLLGGVVAGGWWRKDGDMFISSKAGRRYDWSRGGCGVRGCIVGLWHGDHPDVEKG